MRRGLGRTAQFKHDVKKARKRGKDLAKLWAIVARLLQGQDLEPRHRRHKLTGEWAEFWECHVEPDRLLIWRETEEELILVRTGTHSDLFG